MGVTGRQDGLAVVQMPRASEFGGAAQQTLFPKTGVGPLRPPRRGTRRPCSGSKWGQKNGRCAIRKGGGCRFAPNTNLAFWGGSTTSKKKNRIRMRPPHRQPLTTDDDEEHATPSAFPGSFIQPRGRMPQPRRGGPAWPGAHPTLPTAAPRRRSRAAAPRPAPSRPAQPPPAPSLVAWPRARG